RLMSKRVTSCLCKTGFAFLLASGCTGEKASIKTETAPATVNETTIVKEPELKQAEPSKKDSPAGSPGELFAVSAGESFFEGSACKERFSSRNRKKLTWRSGCIS